MFWIFKRKVPKLSMLIVDQSAEQERLKTRTRLQSEQIEFLTELGGFDTFFDDDMKNWHRQAELLVEIKRDIADVRQRLAKLEGK